MKDKSIFEELFDNLHIYEYDYLKEDPDEKIEELVLHFQQSLSSEEYLLLDELLSRQAVQTASVYAKCFSLGAKFGFKIANEMKEPLFLFDQEEGEEKEESESEDKSEEEQIRQLLQQGMSIRKVAAALQIPKYRVEKIKNK